MTELISILQSLGNQMVEYFWLPLLVWTIIALPVTLLLYRTRLIAPVYQYHSRVALILTLPIGILGAFLADIFASSTISGGGAAFLVVENPISITAGPSEASTTFSAWEPTVWLGILGVLLLAGTTYFLITLTANYIRLKKLETNLSFSPLSQCPELADNLSLFEDCHTCTLIAYSRDTNIPFTYGWRNTRIVIPHDLKTDTELLAMAVQHELLHIKHRDFLLNGLLTFVKALFWFHPLVHYLHNSAQEFREITCDSEVLANKQFSKKKYASLLYKLAKREHQVNLAMSMAVNPSSLKKRIQIMSSQDNIAAKFRSSFLVTLTSAAVVVMAISCTDMAEDGITKSEVEQTQSQIANAPGESTPLYIVNGEEWDESSPKKLSQLKPKYIETIKIFKEEKAIKKYGAKGKNGVVKIEVLNPDKAFSDLKLGPPPPPKPIDSNRGDIFVVVEDMPELKGGLVSLQKEINYPEEARDAGIQGKVIVQFIVNKQGDVENPYVIRGIGGGCDEEALRVVEQAEFEPGKQNGKPVRVQYSLPITYQLSSGEEDL